jgi:hypothetical protein
MIRWKGNITKFITRRLKLEKINPTNASANVLDIDIRIDANNFHCKLFDKRQQFDFQIVSFPCTHSNVPVTMCYSIFSAQLIRIMRICNVYDGFTEGVASLITRIRPRGYKLDSLKATYCKIFRKTRLPKYLPNTPDATWNDIILKVPR